MADKKISQLTAGTTPTGAEEIPAVQGGSTVKLTLDQVTGKNNFTATSAPTVNDDSGDGYSIGSRWIDVTNVRAYVCESATAGAAVWIPQAAQVDVYTTPGAATWTKPLWAQSVDVVVIGAGGGGGSGRRGATSTVRTGGAGGGGGGRSEVGSIPASALGATESISVGQGGAGGPAITVDDTNGTAGTAGGNSSFGASGTLIRATGGGGGGGGSTGAATAGTAGNGELAGAGGGASSGTGAGGTAGTAGPGGAAGGGGGGGLTSANAASSGGAGGARPNAFGATTGGTAGAAGGSGGAGPSASTGFPGSGGGGGGGATSVSAPGGSGGAGGNYGAGGGGGGASLNGNASGAGGAGAHGIVVVVTRLGAKRHGQHWRFWVLRIRGRAERGGATVRRDREDPRERVRTERAGSLLGGGVRQHAGRRAVEPHRAVPAAAAGGRLPDAAAGRGARVRRSGDRPHRRQLLDPLT